MESSTLKQLNSVLQSICEGSEYLRACKYDCAASLLEMAQLELRMKIHDVSEAEFKQFCGVMEKRTWSKNRGQIIKLHPHLAKMNH